LRWEVTREFARNIEKFLPTIREVALVGGGPNEPELEIIKPADSRTVTYFGIEQSSGVAFNYLDLNTDSDFFKAFDLVICSQVLEHVWNHQAVFDNLARLVKPGGLLWISCPASNFAHGSPGYYSAGFAPEYIEKNLELRNFELITSNTLGSKRYYFLTHALQIWGTRNLHTFPLFFGLSRFYPREFLGRLFSLTLSPKIRYDLKFATETYVLLRKIKW
jgi:SAM-dependent methyltransferase